jgi:hypothetical protein
MANHEFSMEEISGSKNVLGYPDPPRKVNLTQAQTVFKAESHPVKKPRNPQKPR